MWTRITPLPAAALAALLVLAVGGCVAFPLSQTGDPGPYRYTRSRGASLYSGTSQFSVLLPFTREIWIASNGSGRLRQEYGSPVFFGERDRAHWDPVADAHTPMDVTFGSGQLTYIDLADLPADPGALRDALAASLGTPSPAASDLLAAATGLLRETVAPTTIRTAVFEMLMREPTISHNTRSGHVVFSAVADDYVELSITLDTETHDLVHEEQTLMHDSADIDAHAPVRIGYVDYLESWVVNELAR